MNLPVFKVDQEFFCLGVESIKRAVRSSHAWMRVESAEGVAMRKMARCLLRRHGDRVFLADVVTGTLYREDTGQCMTSSARRVIGPDVHLATLYTCESGDSVLTRKKYLCSREEMEAQKEKSK